MVFHTISNELLTTFRIRKITLEILNKKTKYYAKPTERQGLMKKCFGTNFLLCGFCGWCMECLWTGIGSLMEHKDKELSCRTSLWMFPIYGMAACFSPICKRLKDRSTALRGSIYAICIYFAEFTTGTLLKKFHACPWDYSKAKLNYHGVIRFDYAPAWFAAGLFFEKLLSLPNFFKA